MRWGTAGLIAAVLALAGCKSTSDPKSKDREPVGLSAAIGKKREPKDTKDVGGQKWLNGVSRGDGVKAGNRTDDPRSPDFDAKAAAQDAVGGKVVDSYGRPAKNVFIRVEGVNDAPGVAALGIMTNDNGYFFSTGLKPGQTYNLRAEASQDGKQLSGSVQTRIPNPILLITLREEPAGVPPAGDERPPAGGGFPPLPAEGNHIPPTGVATPAPRAPRADDSFSPETGSTRSLPPSLDGASTKPKRPAPPATAGELPEPEDVSLPAGRPIRPENVADGPRGSNPFTPPSANVPGPNVPTYPVPPVTRPGGSAPPKESRGPTSSNFRLIDSMERYWDFASDRGASVVLLEFATTACARCKYAVPILKDVQSRYAAAGFQVVAVLCDDLPRKERAAAAGKYARDNNVNYAVFVEPGASPGDVRDQFDVAAYPTAVLLDANGTVLWKGDPVKDKSQLDAAVKKAVGK